MLLTDSAVDCPMRSLQEVIFRYRDRIAVAFFLAILAALVHTGKTLGLSESREDWLDALGCGVAALGHALRVLALRHIGPRSRTTNRFKVPRLVREGPYALVRNPLYLGNCLIALGLCLIAQLRWLLLTGPFLAFLLYYLVAVAEERRLLEQFGEEYLEYSQVTPRFFPRGLLRRWGWRTLLKAGKAQAVFRTKEYQAFLCTGTCVLLIELVEQLRRASGLA
jgi:protein-S-isoprenylcysteine O-methyltransferase Ste14